MVKELRAKRPLLLFIVSDVHVVQVAELAIIQPGRAAASDTAVSTRRVVQNQQLPSKNPLLVLVHWMSLLYWTGSRKKFKNFETSAV